MSDTPPTISPEARKCIQSIAEMAHKWTRREIYDDDFIEFVKLNIPLAITTATEALAKENQRLFDLVRYQRAELHEAGLINDKEYTDLVTEQDGKMKGSVARLEAYDQLTKENAELKQQVAMDSECIERIRKAAIELEVERDQLQARVKELEVPICIGQPIITILAETGEWRSEDGRGVIAASDLFHNNPYKSTMFPAALCQKCSCDGDLYHAAINLHPVGTTFRCPNCFTLFTPPTLPSNER